MFMLPNWTFKIVLLMISPAARDGLTDLLDDLEFFLEVAEESIEERDKIIRELVASLEAMTEAVNGARSNAQIYACRDLIARARALVPC
jgi:hypothetical protein